jgi:hypothetical protein
LDEKGAEAQQQAFDALSAKLGAVSHFESAIKQLLKPLFW